MLVQLIQRQVQIGNSVTFSLKNGDKVSGVLVEIGREHITLENDEGVTTILVEMIGAWEVLGNKTSELKTETISDFQPSKDIPEAKKAQPDTPSPQAKTTPPDSEKSLKPVFKKIVEIEAHFQAHLQTARIELKPPDFIFPAEELGSRHRSNAATIWERIMSKYKYALQINELSAKFGRIQPITRELESLAGRFPGSSSLKRHLACFYFLLGKEQESIESYKDAATTSQDKNDWYNVAVLALKTDRKKLACYALEQVFCQSPVNEELEAWYVYVRLLNNTGNYLALTRLCETTERNLSEEELVSLLEIGIYLLKVMGKGEAATKLVYQWLEGKSLRPLVLEATNQLGGQPSESYQKTVAELSKKDEKKTKTKAKVPQRPQGYIHIYKRDRSFGFLKDLSGSNYFFHRSAIVDTTLYDKLDHLGWGERIPVVFETAEGPRGPLALRVALFRTTDELFEIATDCARDSEYARAIGYIKQLLNRDAKYPEAQGLYEKWREYARVIGVPRGSSPYARAKQVQLIEKDLDRAAQLFRQAINQGDNTESAVKDLANLLVQQGQPQQAIEFLQKNRKKIQNQQSVDRMLQGFYWNAGQYAQLLTLLRKKLDHVHGKEKRSQVLWQIANCYLRQEDYTKAKQEFAAVLKLRPDNLAARRNIAICHFKQRQFDEAERILNDILDTSPDAKAAELLEAIAQAKTTGRSAEVDEIIIETALSDLSGELGGFTRFFLDRCEFPGVALERIKKDEGGVTRYEGSERDARFDLRRLDEFAKQAGTRRSRERAGYYLSASRITAILESESSNQFYRYLCRSFASSGDATIAESKPLDAARELYCEALGVYDGYRKPDGEDRYDEQDVVNALTRFIFSYLGRDKIPTSPPRRDDRESVHKQQLQYVENAVEQVVPKHPQSTKIFNAVSYLVLRSRYAANQVLRNLYGKSPLQDMALEYLRGEGISVPDKIGRLDDFIKLWNELRRHRFDEWRAISSEFRFLTRIELTTASLEASIERLKAVNHRLFFDLDQERSRQLQTILETTLNLVRQISFEEQERLCIQVESRCNDLLREIEGSPTKLSVEELYPVIKAVRSKTKEYLEELYISSVPQVELRLPVESHVPDNNRQIEVQVVAANGMGRSPAESLELIVQEDENLFTLNVPEIRLDGSLRGGEPRFLVLPIQVTPQALQSQTFSLPMYAQYRTRSGDTEQTRVHSFSIRLYPEEEFEVIENPYAAYAEGGIVGDPTMFYGRDELINNITKAIQESRSQSKSIVVFGQKRAGKSSILYHLKKKLNASKDLLILDLGNIGSILDEQSSAPLLYQILWSILRKLEYAVEDMAEDECLIPLGMTFPSDSVFYSHPSPLVLFKDVFDRYKRKASRTEGWQNLRVVLLIDEFSYVYGLIMSGHIPELFMKNWKAILQENYFSVVLAGQDVMPKFKQRFPNEFGTTQDERVSYLKYADAVKLIDEPIRIGGRQGESRYRERAIDLIVDLTAGNPFYIQIICDRLVKYMNRRHAGLVTKADVKRIKNELIRGVNALSLDKFDNLINSGDTSEDAISDEDALKVLKAVAVNSQTGPCNRNSIACETRMPVDVILDDLVNREVIERERARYYQIRVGLFKDWLIAHQ